MERGVRPRHGAVPNGCAQGLAVSPRMYLPAPPLASRGALRQAGEGRRGGPAHTARLAPGGMADELLPGARAARAVRRRFLTAAALPAVAAALLGASIAAAQDAPEGDRLVPAWIRTVAAAWSGGDISDAEFVAAMGFLINEGIIPASEPEHEGVRYALADHVHEYDLPHMVQEGVTYGDQYVHYFEHRIGPIADIAAPNDDGKCIDEFGKVQASTIRLKFRQNEYTKSLVDITGAGINVDDGSSKHLWYQFFNKTHAVGPVLSVQALASGLQVQDTSWIYDLQTGMEYEIRSVYGNQCGRSEMILGY